MANTFKTVTVSNVDSDSTNPTVIYTVPSGATCVVLGLLCVNKVTSPVRVTVLLDSNTTNSGASNNDNITLGKSLLLPVSSSLEFMSGQKYILQTNDSLKAFSDSTSSVDICFNYMEIT